MSSSPPDPVLHAFGMHVRRLREARGITLEELAARSGLSFRGVAYIEHGRRNPSLTTILNLAAGLGALPSYLLEVFDSATPAGADPVTPDHPPAEISGDDGQG